MKTNKSWLYYGTAIASILTLIGIWTHLAITFSIFEVKSFVSDTPEQTFSGGIIASVISFFLIMTAIGRNKLEKYLENKDDEIVKINKKKKNKKNASHGIELKLKYLKSVNQALWFFGIIEVYANIYYFILADLHINKVTFEKLADIDLVSWVSMIFISVLLTVISITGARLMSIFSSKDLNEMDEMDEMDKVETPVILIPESKMDSVPTQGLETLEEHLNKSISEMIIEDQKTRIEKPEPSKLPVTEQSIPGQPYFKS